MWIHVSLRTCFGEERHLLGGCWSCGTRVYIGYCNCAVYLKGYKKIFFWHAPRCSDHRCQSSAVLKSRREADSIPMLSPRSSCLRHTGFVDHILNPVQTTASMKAAVYETIVKIITVGWSRLRRKYRLVNYTRMIVYVKMGKKCRLIIDGRSGETNN